MDSSLTLLTSLIKSWLGWQYTRLASHAPDSICEILQPEDCRLLPRTETICSVKIFDFVMSFSRVEYDIGTVEKLTLTAADRRINMSFMKISYSQGARN